MSDVENLFADLSLDDPDIPDDPNLIPDNTYEAFVYEVKPHTAQSGDPGVKFIYKISQDGPYKGRTVQEWKSLGKGKTGDEALKAKSYIKERLVSIGVAVDAKPEDIVGSKINLSVRNKDGFPGVGRITKAVDSDSTSDALADLGI